MYNGSHKTTILDLFNSDRNDSDSYCDVMLEVDDKKFPAHRCVLGKLSPFFHKMFKSEMKEKYNSVVNIESVSSEAMEVVLDFLYTASVKIVQENVFELLKASDYLQLDELKNLCVTVLVESVDSSNCLHYLQIAQTFNCSMLADKAIKAAALNFQNIRKQDVFNDVSQENVLEIMKAVDQKKISGKLVFKSAMAWVRSDYEGRKGDIVQLLETVDFDELPISFMQRIVAKEDLIKESPESKDFFLNLMFDRIRKHEGADDDEESDDNRSYEKELLYSGEDGLHAHVAKDEMEKGLEDCFQTYENNVGDVEETLSIDLDFEENNVRQELVVVAVNEDPSEEEVIIEHNEDGVSVGDTIFTKRQKKTVRFKFPEAISHEGSMFEEAKGSAFRSKHYKFPPPKT